MTVADLIARLLELPQDFTVVLVADEDKQIYSPVDDFSLEVYEAETSWAGKLVDSEGKTNNSVVLWTAN